jgi:hypothetical protein
MVNQNSAGEWEVLVTSMPGKIIASNFITSDENSSIHDIHNSYFYIFSLSCVSIILLPITLNFLTFMLFLAACLSLKVVCCSSCSHFIGVQECHPTKDHYITLTIRISIVKFQICIKTDTKCLYSQWFLYSIFAVQRQDNILEFLW